MRLLTLALLLLIAGCASSTVTTEESAQEESVIETRENFANIINCIPLEAKERQFCYDDFVKSFAGTKTTKEILAALERARGEEAVIESECHPMVHAIGRWTFVQQKNIGDSFDACDLTCHSGCYHGVMERMFFTEEQLTQGINHLTFADLEKTVPGICDDDKFSDPSPQVIFQCLHGLGHAILYTLGYDLELGLQACDLLSNSYKQSSCYGGLIMENVTAYDPKLRDVDPADPLYPCSKLEEKYLDGCYSMQTSLMIEFGLSEEEIADQCLLAGDYTSKCFVSFGRDYSNYVRANNTKKAVAACETFSVGNEESCIRGVTYALIDNTWDASFAYQFCNALEQDKLKEYCYETSNSYLDWSYRYTDEETEEGCKEFAKDMDLCIEKISA